MELNEAREILTRQLGELRKLSYAELRRLMDNPPGEVEVSGLSGTLYQLEVEVRWDSPNSHENIRVMVSIDDGGLRAFHPLMDDFIKAPDESFVGES